MDLRIVAFKEALDSFVYLARIDLAEIRQMLPDERLVDGFQNGRAQKFEYTTELCWKAEPIAKLFKICSPLPSREGVRGWVKLQHNDSMATLPPP